MDIKGVLGLKKGDIVENLVAQIEGVWDSKPLGKAKTQSIRIKDSSSEIYVSLMNFEIPKEKKGEQILIKKGTVNVYFSAKNKVNVWGINVAKADDIVLGEPKAEAPSIEFTGESNEKTRSMSLAYAKDLCCAGKTGVEGILVLAQSFDVYISMGAFEPVIIADDGSASEIPFGE